MRRAVSRALSICPISASKLSSCCCSLPMRSVRALMFCSPAYCFCPLPFPCLICSSSLLLEFFCLLSGGDFRRICCGGLFRIVVKPLLNVFRQLGEVELGNPAFSDYYDPVRLDTTHLDVLVLFPISRLEVIGHCQRRAQYR